MWRYLKEAFWAKASLPVIGPLPVNALTVAGFGILGCAVHALWPLGIGLETAYLYLLATHPRFQKIVRARDQFQEQRGVEQNRRDSLARLSPLARARADQLENKVRRIAELTRNSPNDDDLLGNSNLDALEKLGALHLRLLGVEHGLQTIHQQTDEASLIRQSVSLERELNADDGRLSPALRESKQATLELLQKRLANAKRRAESITEVESDLARIEAQVELALEESGMEGKPTVVAGNLNLLNRILESNSALRSEDSPDWNAANPEEARARATEGQS